MISTEGLSLSRLAIADMKKPLSLDDIVHLESTRRNMYLNHANEEVHKNEIAEIEQKDLWMAILPGQQSVKECFTSGLVLQHVNEEIPENTSVELTNPQ